jgi:hypothetical protein
LFTHTFTSSHLFSSSHPFSFSLFFASFLLIALFRFQEKYVVVGALSESDPPKDHLAKMGWVRTKDLLIGKLFYFLAFQWI